jgi:hypothetical protein
MTRPANPALSSPSIIHSLCLLPFLFALTEKADNGISVTINVAASNSRKPETVHVPCQPISCWSKICEKGLGGALLGSKLFLQILDWIEMTDSVHVVSFVFVNSQKKCYLLKGSHCLLSLLFLSPPIISITPSLSLSLSLSL